MSSANGTSSMFCKYVCFHVCNSDSRLCIIFVLFILPACMFYFYLVYTVEYVENIDQLTCKLWFVLFGLQIGIL